MPLASSHPYTLHLPDFEGPLDVLLRLIEKNELEITAISLALVADQYLAHVRSLRTPDPLAVAEFLAIAAQLLLIKSRALLPRPEPVLSSDEEPAEQLARQLREYSRFKQAALHLRELEHAGRRSWERLGLPPQPSFEPPALPPQPMAALIKAIERRLQLLAATEPPAVPIPRPRTITIAEVAARIEDLLSQQAFCSFEDVLDLATSRAAVIVTLWTVLELTKREIIAVEQPELFAAISLGRGPRFGQRWALHDSAD